MKKFFAIAILAVASLTANAQAWLGGSFGFDWEKGKWDGAKATTTWKIAPEIGYNINENWAIAGKIAVGGESRYTKEQGLLVEKSVTTFTISPYARYTFAKIDDLSFFVDGGIHFTSYGKDNGSSFGIGVQPGLAYKVADGVTLAAKFGYFGWRTYDKDADYKDQFGLGVDGNNLEFGVYFDL